MSEAILVALISAGVSLTGILISNAFALKKSYSAMQTALAVTDTKLEELTREVRELNRLARKIPVVEEQMRTANTRITDLEKRPRTVS